MADDPKVLIAVDEQYVGHLLEVLAQSLGFETEVADCEADAFDEPLNGRYSLAVTVPCFDKLTSLLTKSSPPTPTLLLCADESPNGVYESEHVQFMKMPCSTERLLLNMASMASAPAPALTRPECAAPS